MSEARPHIVIRADSSKEMGLGHIVRALTLASALERCGAKVTCVGQGMTSGRAIAPSFNELEVRESKFDNELSSALAILELDPDAVITDGYHYSRAFYEVLEDARVPYAVIDDGGFTQAIDPFVVVNQNPDASPKLYKYLANQPRLLLGSDFSLLRSEVGELLKYPPDNENFTVVSLGGTDPKNLTVPIAVGLLQIGQRVMVADRYRPIILDALPGREFEEDIRFFSQEAMLQTMASGSSAVLGAGISLWEASALSIPTIGIIVAENQRGPAIEAQKQGIIDVVVDSLEFESVEELVLQVRAASASLYKGRHKSRPCIPTQGATSVAEIILGELSSHG